MIDIHCHILPGIDDGASDFRESLQMAEMAAEDGVRTIVATPHVINLETSVDKIRSLVDRLNERINERKIPVRVVPGAEILAGAVTAGLGGYALNGTGYVLMEFPSGYGFTDVWDVCNSLKERGLTLVIAHPERNQRVIRKTGRFVDFIRKSGALTQVTAHSVTGLFGREIRACAFRLLKKDAVTFLATDAHSARYRNPVLSEGVAAAAGVVGWERAEQLVVGNPRALLAGEPVGGERVIS